MNWIVKATVQAALGSVPARVADPIYHALQQHRGPLPTEVQAQRAYIKEVSSLLERIQNKQLRGLQVAELGAGWFPILPLLMLREHGARAVHTFDIHHHYSPARIATAALEIIETCEHLRGDPVLRRTALTGRLPENIHYYSRTKIQDFAHMSFGLADLAVSRSVLEYISPDEIRDIHENSQTWLTRDALWIHLIGTSDDRSRHDKNLHRYDFLRYSEKEWERICGNRYAYKNRLRLPQYRSLFESAGWHVKSEQKSIVESDMKMLHRIPLHPDFLSFSPQDLLAGSLRFALLRSNP